MKRRRFGRLALAASLLSWLALPPAWAADARPELQSATCRIFDRETSGTCVLIKPPRRAGLAEDEVVLVSAAHGFQNMRGQECTVVLREKKGAGLARKEVPLKIRSGEVALWVRHPHADVGAIRMKLPPDIVCQPVPFERLAGVEDFENGKVGLGDDAWMCSFPVQLEANEAGQPVLRRGAIASLPLTGATAANRTFLVDITTFGGDSGAAVLSGNPGRREADWRIVGIVSGMHRQSDRFAVPFQETTLHYPLGLAIAAPADLVRETVREAAKEGFNLGAGGPGTAP